MLALAERKLFSLESHFSDEGLMFIHQTDLSHINIFFPTEILSHNSLSQDF